MAAPAEETIEETIADVLDLIDVQGEVFEVYDSDSEDEELEFVDSFVWSTKDRFFNWVILLWKANWSVMCSVLVKSVCTPPPF